MAAGFCSVCDKPTRTMVISGWGICHQCAETPRAEREYQALREHIFDRKYRRTIAKAVERSEQIREGNP